MRKWYNTKESMGSYPSEVGDETVFVELDEAQFEIARLKEYFIRLHTLASVWVDKDHHDWQELMKLRWGD